ncbi:hypothetical protein TNIN_178911 [Trichonephila inaurata madagascariensis]|uniref:Uncharacterized protein n=1 Tax=Trichonephila inaurata madagascariensis TaxID=2747483 RepID=A0A8X6Y9K3_9ARAC|nr:hypothetical protein TNIN_178911 [Trichonephila inaurata madagascariensis]
MLSKGHDDRIQYQLKYPPLHLLPNGDVRRQKTPFGSSNVAIIQQILLIHRDRLNPVAIELTSTSGDEFTKSSLLCPLDFFLQYRITPSLINHSLKTLCGLLSKLVNLLFKLCEVVIPEAAENLLSLGMNFLEALIIMLLTPVTILSGC